MSSCLNITITNTKTGHSYPECHMLINSIRSDLEIIIEDRLSPDQIYELVLILKDRSKEYLTEIGALNDTGNQ